MLHVRDIEPCEIRRMFSDDPRRSDEIASMNRLPTRMRETINAGPLLFSSPSPTFDPGHSRCDVDPSPTSRQKEGIECPRLQR